MVWRVHPWPGCRTLAGTVAGRQGVTVRSSERPAGRHQRASPACHGCSTGHSRDTGQGTVGEPLAAAEGSGGDCGGCASKHHQLLWDRPCCSCSAGHQHQPAAGQCHLLVSTGGDPPNCRTSSSPGHRDSRARWRKLHSFRQRGLVISIMAVIRPRSDSSIRVARWCASGCLGFKHSRIGGSEEFGLFYEG